MASIVITNGPDSGKRFDLGQQAIIGRYPFCDIVLNMGNVSRQHARVTWDGEEFLIEDLNSQNGTFVNGIRIQNSQRLNHNDRINIYQVTLRFLDAQANISPDDVEDATIFAAPETRAYAPAVLGSVNATSDSAIATNAESKWKASLGLMRSLGRSLDTDEMLGRLLCDLFSIFPHADRGYVLFVQPDGSLVLQAMKEDDGTNAAQTLGPVDQTLAEQVIESGQAVLCLDEDVSDGESVLDLPVRSIMCTPLISPLGETLGVLYIDTKQDQKRFDPDDLELLVSVATFAGHTVAFARQHQLITDEHRTHAAELQAEIDERHRVEEELRRSNSELQEFAYAASHDLQEPLRAVSGFVQLLQQRYGERLDDTAAEFIQHSVDGTTRMQSLIRDLLEFSRVRTKSSPFQQTDSNDALDRALSNLMVAIGENNAEVTRGLLPVINADRTQLMQVFQNLIGNAVKFCVEQPPTIHIDCTERDEDWLFRVTDNGIGIASEYSDRVFKIFQRLHTRDEYSGSGVGLAICKRIVERHRGTIWVEKSDETGTTFAFTISKNL